MINFTDEYKTVILYSIRESIKNTAIDKSSINVTFQSQIIHEPITKINESVLHILFTFADNHTNKKEGLLCDSTKLRFENLTNKYKGLLCGASMIQTQKVH